MRKVKGMTKLKSVKKVKSIMDIDDDLALAMKKEVEEGEEVGNPDIHGASPGGDLPSSSEEEVISGEKTDGESETPGEVGPDVQAKIDRILKMFNASSLDDIIEVTPIKSIQEVDPDNLPIRHIPDDRGSVPFGSGEGSESVEEYVPSPGHYFGSGEGSESVDVPSPEHSSFIPARHHHMSSSGLALEKRRKEIKRGEEKLDFEVGELQRETDALDKERALQVILKKMLAVQEDKVAKLKELIEDHKEKEMSTHEAVKHLRHLVKQETHKIEDHLDALKNLADKVRGEEMVRLNRLAPSIGQRPMSGELSGESLEIDFGSNKLTSRPIKSANKIESMKKIKSMKNIKSITDLTEEQAERLKNWQMERKYNDQMPPA